ncbi:response regulator transcription factor [Sulfurimonas autotrophica]|uniref:Two component transcriptional regulator, winged helix family n=1 Tax=Sulfurimonas autotrophica (strain ATCC BAA-671 / DSM 16294 / JCM 11897 / OK10) TaxID=563040 RepID=E0UTS0_SULAO|nr:response regulator transcription factor [Sulfurimonas autotrophica]ADN08301.1 two component transcriptional regulator, winged helix family [Sulfurimonas autotrophica DSM 16294]
MRNKFLKSLKILLVEDEEKLSSLLKNAIGDSFHSFLLAKDGNEGLEIYKKVLPDIVITDIMMPNKTGLEMAKEIKKINPESKIIILSAFSDVEKLLSAIDIGVVKYFIKPFDPDEVLTYILSLEEVIGEKSIPLAEGFVFNKTTKSLYRNNRYIALSKKEIAFLEVLLEENIVAYQKIKKLVWNEMVSDARLRTFIRRLREKTSKELLINIKGEGYQIALS